MLSDEKMGVFIMAKEIVNIANLDANKAMSMLGNEFQYPIEIDSKGRFVVFGDIVKVFIKFKNIGNSTEIKFGGSRYANGKIFAKFLFIPFYYIYAIIKGFEENKSLVKAVADSLRNPKTSSTTNDISTKLSKLKEMKEQGIITEEEFNKKIQELIDKL